MSLPSTTTAMNTYRVVLQLKRNEQIPDSLRRLVAFVDDGAGMEAEDDLTGEMEIPVLLATSEPDVLESLLPQLQCVRSWQRRDPVDVYTMQQAAKALGLSVEITRRYIQTHMIHGTPWGHTHVILPQEIERFQATKHQPAKGI